MDRLIRMIARMFLGEAINHVARRGSKGDDPQKARQGRQAAKRAQQAMRVTRRIGRF